MLSALYSNREFIVSSGFPFAMQQNKSAATHARERVVAAPVCSALVAASVSV
jgi:hypothetical protein